jgi:hypothetical protein
LNDPCRVLRVLVCLLTLFALVGGSLSVSATQLPQDLDRRLVTALYYPWYGEAMWDDPVLSDRPAIPYNGWDPEAMSRHIRWARAAGIDVLVSAWFGNQVANGTEDNLRTLLDLAQPAGMRVAILFETDAVDFFPSFEAQRAAVQHVIDVHARHPAYFYYQGSPVIYFWRPRGIWVGNRPADRDSEAAVDAWRQLRNTVDPDRKSIWIAEGEYPPYLDVFDGLFPYNIAWAPDPAARLEAYAHAVRSFPTGTGPSKLWVATAMPGYDDTRIPGRPGRFAVNRAGGEFYRRSFAAAVDSGPDWINISSFNEWVEGHQIEPSVTYGDLYLRLTAELVADWKRGRP